ncbi:hypothetical protein [Thalassomonas actiniarum]|uniref:Spore coat protein U domain-containing protein n=1 Tax=Thalassomonas actiniarum TaxID=485447 RepID=A0AAF0C3X2_9GAMM|nr:hypothetical protein [Thalassomonas actiniarum]WDE00013.1 hypothetical protein SG35_004945 [Thalassomonas actiniarum]
MKNLNKIVLPLSLLALTSTAALASESSYFATVKAFTEPTFAEATAMHFGKMNVIVGSVCTMDAAGAVTGDCDAADAAITQGEITVSGLEKSTAYNITVTGEAGASLTYTTAAEASDGTTTVTTADGVASAFTTDASATDIAVKLYGALAVTTELVAGSDNTVGYTVNVSFN